MLFLCRHSVDFDEIRWLSHFEGAEEFSHSETALIPVCLVSVIDLCVGVVMRLLGFLILCCR